MITYFKKAGLAGMLAALMFTGFAFQTNQPYSVTGRIAGLPDGTILELLPAATHKEEKPEATAVVKEGKFVFQGELASPRLYFVKIGSTDYDGFQLMIDKGQIEITGSASQASANGRKSWALKDVTIKGSNAHDMYLQKTSLRSRLNELYNNYNNSNKQILDQVSVARNKKDTVLEKKLLASDAYKKLEKEEAGFFKTAEDSINAMIMSNKDSWWGPFLMLNELSYFRPSEKELFDQFSKEAKESYYGQIVAAELYPVSLVGKAAPSLNFTDQSGKKVPFSSIAKGKKYVLIDFWASWCQPCRKAIPGLKQFYSQHGKTVEIISISIDKKKTDWMKANTDEKFPWPSFLDQQEIGNAYNVKAIPAMFLLDAKGNVVAEQVSLEEVKEKIK